MSVRTGLDPDQLDQVASGLERATVDQAGVDRVPAATNGAEPQAPDQSAPTSAPITLAAAEFNDKGNARRFVALHRNDVRYVPEIGAPGGHVQFGWHHWDGRRWAPDMDGEIERRAKQTVRAMRQRALQLPKEQDRALTKWAHASGNRARLEAMVKLARSERPVIARVDQLDANPMLLNVTNGTVDLRTGERREHRRGDLLTKLAGATYDPDATCPTFERFLTETLGGDAGLIRYLQRAAGYTLTGDTREQCLFVLRGDGANGKSTLLAVLAAALNDYATSADAGSFTTAAAGRSVRSDLARLRGARYVRAAEIERGATLAESLVKQLTGGDPITAAYKFCNEFEYLPAFKLWIAANELPAVLGDDHAIWRRLRIIPFEHRVATPDRELPQKLRAELPGILAWAVRGCLDWQRHGLGTCRAVDQATTTYGDTQDRVGAFLDERCAIDPQGRVENGHLVDAYRAWEHDRGRAPLTDLYARLDRRGFKAIKSNGKRYRAGLTLRDHESADRR